MPKTIDDPLTGAASGRPANPAATDSSTLKPSGFQPAATSAVATTDVGAGAPFSSPSAKGIGANTAPRSDQTDRKTESLMDQTFDSTTRDKTAADASKLGDDAKRIRDDAAVVGEDLAKLAREAVSALQRVADDLATKAGNRAGEAVDVAKSVGLATVDNVTAAAGDAKQRVDSGVETLSQSVARNPLTAVAIAAGVGMLFGMMNRSSHR